MQPLKTALELLARIPELLGDKVAEFCLQRLLALIEGLEIEIEAEAPVLRESLRQAKLDF